VSIHPPPKGGGFLDDFRKVHDVKVLDELLPEPGAFYIMDRAYLDFARLYRVQFV
jgi:hypothetical protein